LAAEVEPSFNNLGGCCIVDKKEACLV
jgi:hypothetical protein